MLPAQREHNENGGQREIVAALGVSLAQRSFVTPGAGTYPGSSPPEHTCSFPNYRVYC